MNNSILPYTLDDPCYFICYYMISCVTEIFCLMIFLNKIFLQKEIRQVDGNWQSPLMEIFKASVTYLCIYSGTKYRIEIERNEKSK